MKRHWRVVLAAAPLVVALMVAAHLAARRPKLVALGPIAIDLVVSKDGKYLFARNKRYNQGQNIDLSDGLHTTIPTADLNYQVLYSPDNQHVYQVDVFKGEKPRKESEWRRSIASRGVRPGAKDKEFVLPISYRDKGFFGVISKGDQIIARSQHKIWRFDADSLRLLGVTQQRSTLANVTLCPDGQTVYRYVGGANAVQFIDLKTEKQLWQLPLEERFQFEFSSDGQLVITQEKGAVIARDTRTGAEKWRLRGPKSHVLALSPDQRFVYESRENGELWKWPR